MKPREAAYKVVYEVLYREGYSTIVLDGIRKQQGFSTLDSSFITNIALGTLRSSIFIEYVIKKYSNIRVNKISPSVMTVLKTGAYQILYMDRVPDSAACNESVKIAGRFGGAKTRGFVNGVLRTISRNKDSISKLTDGLSGLERLSVEYSFVKEAVKAISESFGKEKAEDILSNLNKTPELCIRSNYHGDIENLLTEEEISFDKGIFGRNAYYIKPGKDITITELYKQGKIAIQDEGAQQMVEFLNPKEGESILDACAAPGGKTGYIHCLTNGESNIIAVDADCSRVGRMKENLSRMGAGRVMAECMDMSVFHETLKENYDAVLLDVPCSGLGTSQRRPEIKLRYKSSDQLIELQSQILDTSSGYLKKGGRLVYGTCTLNKTENEIQVGSFIARNRKFSLKEEKTILPDGRRGGFYMAMLVKND